MKPINKILNKPNQVLGSLTKQALMNQYYTKTVKKYLNNTLINNTTVHCYKNGNLTLATTSNEKLTLLRYEIPELLINLRKDSLFTGLVSIKATINKFYHKDKKLISNNGKNIAKRECLSETASCEIESLARSIKHDKLYNALMQLSKRKDIDNP